MPIDIKTEIARVRKFYEEDERQKGFNLLLLGEMGTGKTFLLRTCRKPIWIDSFDPGGTKCLRKWIEKGEIIADTQYENEDPFNPTAYKLWRSNFKKRYAANFFDGLGTYVIDSSTTFAAAIMNWQLSGGDETNSTDRSGTAPKWSKDYTPQKIELQNYISKALNVPCDFILTGHLQMKERKIGERKDGEAIMDIKFRYMAVGQASVFIPLKFDEVWVALADESSRGVRRRLLLDSTGEYLARSRLKSDGMLNTYEDPDIKGILKKVGINAKDKELV
jgi:hypothetical protein